MALRTRSKSAPTREKAGAKDTVAVVATSQAHYSDSEEIPDRPTERPRITREMTTQDRTTGVGSSRQAVLQTNELLESILAFLPSKQLFVDRRICKQWRDVIASSPELQRKMFLRIDEVPRQTWGLNTDFFREDSSTRFEVRRFDNSLLSRPWRQVTPIALSPHLTIDGVCVEDLMGACDGQFVAIQLPCNLPVGRRISVLDTYLSNPPCYHFTIYLNFKFEPAIPRYGRLAAGLVEFKTGKALTFGEALDKAMAIRTDVKLHKDYRDESVKTKAFRNISVTEIIKKFQRGSGCTAILCESSMIFMGNVVVPNEQQRAEVDAAYEKMIQRTE